MEPPGRFRSGHYLWQRFSLTRSTLILPLPISVATAFALADNVGGLFSMETLRSIQFPALESISPIAPPGTSTQRAGGTILVGGSGFSW